MKMNSLLYNLIISKRIYIILGLLFIFGLIVINYNSESFVTNENAIKTSADTANTFSENNNYSLENKLKKTLCKVDGVGDVDVFINYKRNKDATQNNIIFKSSDLKADNNAEVEGIIVVAQGGGDAGIVSIIRNSVSEAFGLPLHKVIVLKMVE